MITGHFSPDLCGIRSWISHVEIPFFMWTYGKTKPTKQKGPYFGYIMHYQEPYFSFPVQNVSWMLTSGISSVT